MLSAANPDRIDDFGLAYNTDGISWPRYRGSLLSALGKQPLEVFAPSGGAAMYRRDVFVAAGGFDERFFVYYEEVDLSLRAKKAGFRSYYLAEAFAHHTGGTSTSQAGPRRLFYYLQSRLKYAKKNFEPLSYLLLLQFTLGVEFVLRSLRALGRKGEDQRSTLTAFGMLWAWLMKEETGTRDL